MIRWLTGSWVIGGMYVITSPRRSASTGTISSKTSEPLWIVGSMEWPTST
jgi:hypothetical protein